MSSFRKYGGLQFSANHNITKSHILNSEKMNVNNYSGRENSKEVCASHIDMSGNSILHLGTVYFQDGTSLSSTSGVTGTPGPTGPTGTDGAPGEKGEKGNTGPEGPKGATGDSGIVTIVPIVQFGNITSNSANIYIPITYPDQTYNGAIPAPVPVIAGCIFNLTTDVTTDVTTILDTRITSTNGNSNGSAFNSYYVRPVSFFNTDQKYPGYTGPGSTSSYPGLQGIVLTNSTTINSSIKSVPITFSDGVTRNAIYYNTNSITSLGTTGTISGQYYDYADYSVSTSKSFHWYTEGIKPGTDGSSWLTTGNSPTTSDIYLSYIPPNQIQYEVIPNVPGVNITNFKGTFKTTGNTSAYGGPFTETGESVFTYYPETQYNNVKTNNQFSNLYPESQYYFGLYSQNSATTTYSKNVYYPDNTTDYGFTGPTTAILQIYQTYSPSTCNINNYDGQIFATSFVTGKTIYAFSDKNGSTNITNLFFNNGTITTKSFKSFSVSYNQDSRGKNGQDKILMDINTKITNTYDTYDSTVSFNGFSTNNATITNNNNNITYLPNPPTTIDMYTNINDKFKGYYLKSNGFTETINNIGATSTQYTMNLEQKWYNISGTPINTVTASQKFYYDSLIGNPSINYLSSYSFNDATKNNNMFNVSGISVIATTAIFNLSINVTNLYSYFYVSPVLNYAFSGGCTGTTDVSNLSNYNNPTENNTFTLTVSPTVSPAFNNSQILNVTAYNLNGSTGPQTITSSSIPAIYDKKSYDFINNGTTNPTSIPKITSTSVGATAGYRVWSNIDSLPGVQYNATNTINLVIPPPYKYTNNNSNYSYSQFKYDQSWSIVDPNTSITNPLIVDIDTSQEIQIYDGHYGTGKTETSGTGTNGYIDYTKYYNNLNNVNYLGVSRSDTSYRYTTFVWQAKISGTSPNNFVFTFKNIKVDGLTPTLYANGPPFYFVNTNNKTNRFFLFYRTENANNTTTDTTYNSLWVDGNANGTTTYANNTLTYEKSSGAVANGNYNLPYDNTTVRYQTSVNYAIDNNSLIATLGAIPIPNYYTVDINIYCRFGNSMTTNISYESVSLTLT